MDGQPIMRDRFGRRIDYVRLSVTDRCDLRCRYCMPTAMRFLPRRDLLTIDQLAILAECLIGRGVRRIRLTGGEPLVRPGVIDLAHRLGGWIGRGLEELTLTTNGTQLARHAGDLFAAGVRRINVSLDSRDPERFAFITRGGDLRSVLAGIDAADAAGLAVKINMVALAGLNEDEIAPMLDWCAGRGFDLSLIETMPLGETGEDRMDHFLPLDRVLARLRQHHHLAPSAHRTSGPARYHDVAGIRLGLITPISDNFCAGCNRIRIAATGTVYGCLGHDQKVELRDALREGGPGALETLLDTLIAGKPERHAFELERPAIARHMSVTGG